MAGVAMDDAHIRW